MKNIKDLLTNIDACIFDMDGTIIDSMSIWHDVDIEYFARFNIPMPPNYGKEIEGLSVIEVAKYTKEHYPFPRTIDEMISDWNVMAHEHYSTIVEYKKGAREFLKWCKANGIKTGVATSNSTYLYSAVSTHLGFETLIDEYVTGEDVEHGKPDPECYLKVAAKLKVDPNRCLVFEDLVLGIKAGIAAGMYTCGIEDWYSKPQEIEKRELADYFIEDYSVLL